MTAFRRYFDEYPDQHAEDDVIEAISASSARAVWRLAATSVRTGARLVRSGKETVAFDTDGRIVSVEVIDYSA